MHYTLNKIVLIKNDKSLSVDPRKYKKGAIIGDELIAFMTAHLNGRTWRVGDSSTFGHHSFLLTINPTKDALIFWRQALKNRWKVQMSCSGSLIAVDSNGLVHDPPSGIHDDSPTVQRKQLPQQDIDKIAKRLIKSVF